MTSPDQRPGQDRLLDLVGWSMGAAIAMIAANAVPARLGRVVLLDHAGGGMDYSVMTSESAGAAVERFLREE